MRGNSEVRCGDCEHFTDDGCEEAAEALVLEGWPRASVCPEDSADASRCPEFSLADTFALAVDEDRSAHEAQARVAAIKNFMSW